ncbi:phage head closure protein [Ruegeria meonggei]|uniref:phage head closure protein n=1 Tax=Ruegeria meonggei TaxID=1446476 RepID=UPI00366DE7E6
MIRAGKLDRQITIERETETVAASGAVSKTWAPVATIRAELVQLSAEEYLTGFGEGDASGAVFRIRYLNEITTADRVTFDSTVYDIDEIVEQGRKRGLELRCSVVAS